MKILIAFSLWATLSQTAFSMPCDTGYICTSKTGKYKIELQRCRYRNSLHLESTKINGNEIKNAVLNSGWDGDTLLAFEINLPTKIEGAVKILTAEFPHKDQMGNLNIEYTESEPAPLKIIHHEKILCKVDE